MYKSVVAVQLPNSKTCCTLTKIVYIKSFNLFDDQKNPKWPTAPKMSLFLWSITEFRPNLWLKLSKVSCSYVCLLHQLNCFVLCWRFWHFSYAYRDWLHAKISTLKNTAPKAMPSTDAFSSQSWIKASVNPCKHKSSWGWDNAGRV